MVAAKQVIPAYTPVNYTPTNANLDGYLEGLDTAFSNAVVGVGGNQVTQSLGTATVRNAYDQLIRSRAELVAEFPPVAGLITVDEAILIDGVVALDPGERIALATGGSLIGTDARRARITGNVDIATAPLVEADGLTTAEKLVIRDITIDVSAAADGRALEVSNYTTLSVDLENVAVVGDTDGALFTSVRLGLVKNCSFTNTDAAGDACTVTDVASGDANGLSFVACEFGGPGNGVSTSIALVQFVNCVFTADTGGICMSASPLGKVANCTFNGSAGNACITAVDIRGPVVGNTFASGSFAIQCDSSTGGDGTIANNRVALSGSLLRSSLSQDWDQLVVTGNVVNGPLVIMTTGGSVTDCTFANNESAFSAFQLLGAGILMADSILQGNICRSGALIDSTAVTPGLFQITNSQFLCNQAGNIIDFASSNNTLSGCLIAGNISSGRIIDNNGDTAAISNCTVVNNISSAGILTSPYDLNNTNNCTYRNNQTGSVHDPDFPAVGGTIIIATIADLAFYAPLAGSEYVLAAPAGTTVLITGDISMSSNRLRIASTTVTVRGLQPAIAAGAGEPSRLTSTRPDGNVVYYTGATGGFRLEHLTINSTAATPTVGAVLLDIPGALAVGPAVVVDNCYFETGVATAQHIWIRGVFARISNCQFRGGAAGVRFYNDSGVFTSSNNHVEDCNFQNVDDCVLVDNNFFGAGTRSQVTYVRIAGNMAEACTNLLYVGEPGASVPFGTIMVVNNLTRNTTFLANVVGTATPQLRSLIVHNNSHLDSLSGPMISISNPSDEAALGGLSVVGNTTTGSLIQGTSLPAAPESLENLNFKGNVNGTSATTKMPETNAARALVASVDVGQYAGIDFIGGFSGAKNAAGVLEVTAVGGGGIPVVTSEAEILALPGTTLVGDAIQVRDTFRVRGEIVLTTPRYIQPAANGINILGFSPREDRITATPTGNATISATLGASFVGLQNLSVRAIGVNVAVDVGFSFFFSMKNCEVDNTASGATAIQFSANGGLAAENPMIDSCLLTIDSAGTGGGFVFTAAVESPVITNNVVRGAGFHVVLFNGVTRMKLSGNKFYNTSTGAGIYATLIMERITLSQITDNLFAATGAPSSNAFRHFSPGSSPATTGFTRNQIANNDFLVPPSGSTPLTIIEYRSMIECSFVGNKANNAAGNFFQSQDDASLVDCNFRDNDAEGPFLQTNGAVTDSSFTGNKAGGPIVYHVGNATTQRDIEQCQINNNRSSSSPIVRLGNVTNFPDMTETELNDNRCVSGNLLQLDAGNSVLFCTISGNMNINGDLILMGVAGAIVQGCIVNNNRAGANMFERTGTPGLVTGCNIVGNNAGGSFSNGVAFTAGNYPSTIARGNSEIGAPVADFG